MSDISRLANTITCHAWNADGTKVAVCPNNNEIHVYKKAGTAYTLEAKLTEHDQVVTGIDWAPKTNRIVSCSHDRNAYVWTLEGSQWKPVLVILRLNRAATHVKWSPEENKFAVSSGSKCVSVCYFEEDNNWWVSKHIKKHRSTVISLDWHPNNALLATTCTDYKTRIFSAYIKGVDQKLPNTPFGNKLPFGEQFAEIDCGAWTIAVKWSPDGNSLAYTGQDSTLNVADIRQGTPQVTRISLTDLPLRDLIFINDNTIVAAGYDCAPFLFQNKGSWSFVKKLDGEGPKAAAAATNTNAFKVFQNKVDLGTETAETKLNTKHQNAISCVQIFKKSGANVTHYTTTGVDGNIIVWEAKF